MNILNRANSINLTYLYRYAPNLNLKKINIVLSNKLYICMYKILQ